MKLSRVPTSRMSQLNLQKLFSPCKHLWEKLYCEHINSEWVNNVIWDVLLRRKKIIKSFCSTIEEWISLAWPHRTVHISIDYFSLSLGVFLQHCFVSLLIWCNLFGQKSTALFMSSVEHTKFSFSFFSKTLTWHFAAVEWRNYNSSRTAHKRCKMIKTRVKCVAQPVQKQNQSQSVMQLETYERQGVLWIWKDGKLPNKQQVRMPTKVLVSLTHEHRSVLFSRRWRKFWMKSGNFWAKPTQYFLSSYH